MAAECIKEFALFPKYADKAVQDGCLPALVKVIQTNIEPDVLVQVMLAIGNIAAASTQHQTTIGGTQGAITSTVMLLQDCKSKSLLLAVTEMIAKVCQDHESNQNAFIAEGVASHVITLTTQKHKDIQLNSVQAIHALAKDNQQTQQAIMEEGVVMPLLQLLRKSRAPKLQECTAGALWALAGGDTEDRRTMADMMGVPMLIEFLTSLSQELHYIGSEGLAVLAQGPLSKQTEIATSNGVHPLVRLLKSDQERIVLSVIRTLRFLCIGVGYVPHPDNQGTISQSRGIRFLITMMAHSQNELIQVEAAHSLAAVALGLSFG